VPEDAVGPSPRSNTRAAMCPGDSRIAHCRLIPAGQGSLRRSAWRRRSASALRPTPARASAHCPVRHRHCRPGSRSADCRAARTGCATRRH
jgi:hypothetical protein